MLKRQSTAAIAFATAAAWPASAFAQGAEFAIRWDPQQGGPKSLSEVQQTLGLEGAKEKRFEVRYITIDQPGGAVRAIARERKQEDGDAESMFKLRGPAADRASIEKSACPLAGKKPEFKLEYDVTWTDVYASSKKQSRRKQALSWSCTVEQPWKLAFPASFHPREVPCSSTMRRIKADAVKMEHWKLTSGREVIEVSMDAASPKDWKTFDNAVAKPLVEAKVHPLKHGMTELGSTCAAQ